MTINKDKIREVSNFNKSIEALTAKIWKSRETKKRKNTKVYLELMESKKLNEKKNQIEIVNKFQIIFCDSIEEVNESRK